MQRIIIADKNRLMREMLAKAISTDKNLKILKVLNSYNRIAEVINKEEVDWVIISLPKISAELPVQIKDILVNHSHVGILVVSPDGSSMRVKWLEVEERVLDGISLDELIGFLADGSAKLQMLEEKEKEQS